MGIVPPFQGSWFGGRRLGLGGVAWPQDGALGYRWAAPLALWDWHPSPEWALWLGPGNVVDEGGADTDHSPERAK